MKRIFKLVKGGHDVRMRVCNLPERPHAEWLMRQRPRKENKKMSCLGMGDLSFTAIDTYLFFICDEFPWREEMRLSPDPNPIAHPAGRSVGVACRSQTETQQPLLLTFFCKRGYVDISSLPSFQKVLAVSILFATLAGKQETNEFLWQIFLFQLQRMDFCQHL